MENKIPKTKEECFALLDEMLSDENKKTIIKEDVYKMHFGLGMWIRNNWLYSQSDEEIKELLKTFKKRDSFIDLTPIHRDCVSSEILEAYQKHLKKTINK